MITIILYVIPDTSLLRGSWAKHCGSSGEPFEGLPMEINSLYSVEEGEWQHAVMRSRSLSLALVSIPASISIFLNPLLFPLSSSALFFIPQFLFYIHRD